ncbi:hypothetical protein BP6252_11739 [Coleophoma cylindrospora]|uniref:Uncharacterized protein n=1 Tax=Coleophoma cylindrospora TaxID=1849047 RepID=A0A3D8QKF5_9HELO|nr:hypothetical protein BP6252_11739 [Coleophoma cylindrospora]
MSPEILSDRPIRPLPKRRLRERLSPDVAESIKYPPAPKTTTPLFYYPYNPREDNGLNGHVEPPHPSERERADEIERNYISRRNGEDLDSDEDEIAYRSHIYPRHSADNTGRSYRYVQKPDSKSVNPLPPASSTSSADGYDSFENTNNKKKRKIPTPGDSLNGAHLSGDLAAMGMVGPEDTLTEDGSALVGSYQSPGSMAQGISGPGRGRYGRVRNGRSPLRTLSDASNNWTNGRTTKQRQPQWPASPSESTGIISTAIANAEKTPITPVQGQENFSLLQQQASKKSTPASAQFTFTCDSQVPGTIPWPGQSTSNSKVSTHGTQTSPNMSSMSSAQVVAQAKQGLAASQNSKHSSNQTAQNASSKKSRRRTGKEYLIAARHRRQQQEYQNYHHPPALEDIWICEFCEYERIFGTPPVALIRQYERKDRRIKKAEAERRRLLEKAKLKGRKGKKGNKAAATAKNVSGHDRQSQAPASSSNDHSQSQSQGTQSEEYYEDEYDEEYPQDDLPPQSPSRVPPAGQSRNQAIPAHNGISPVT